MVAVAGCQYAREIRMNLRLASVALVALSVGGSGAGFAQVDPYWLNSWNEAQKTRPASMTSSARIAPVGEPGMPLVLRGQIVEPDGHTPAAGVVVHSYHRDQKGFDFGPNDSAMSTWRLQGGARTDASGQFEFQTIRPAPDHLGREAAHIHLTLESPKFGRQWAPTIFLSGEPKVVDGVEQVSARVRLKSKADF